MSFERVFGHSPGLDHKNKLRYTPAAVAETTVRKAETTYAVPLVDEAGVTIGVYDAISSPSREGTAGPVADEKRPRVEAALEVDPIYGEWIAPSATENDDKRLAAIVLCALAWLTTNNKQTCRGRARESGEWYL